MAGASLVPIEGNQFNWQHMPDPDFLELKADPISFKKFDTWMNPETVRFQILPGSGIGDQYMFQGVFDLGEGWRTYNLTLSVINVSVPEGETKQENVFWKVTTPGQYNDHKASDAEKMNGLASVLILSHTLPEIHSYGERYRTTEWLQRRIQYIVESEYPATDEESPVNQKVRQLTEGFHISVSSETKE